MDDLVEHAVTVAGRELSLLVPPDAEELIDEDAFAVDEFLPYWASLWPSAVSLAEALAERSLAGARVVELGCGLGVPSIVAALDGAGVVATDWAADAIDLLRTNAARNGAILRAVRASWSAPDALVALGPFDLVLASDVLYEARYVELLLALLPRLGAEVLLAEPGRPFARPFFERAAADWEVERLPNRVYRLVAQSHKRLSERPSEPSSEG